MLELNDLCVTFKVGSKDLQAVKNATLKHR
jgi:hypothetical protein